MNHGSLFSGIGGFDLASQWMGWINVFHCENNPFGKKVLQYYWPNAISYDDIRTTDFTVHRGKIDILTGGFPCQPFSLAGKRKGTEDDRHLWPEMLRAIREINPAWVVGENVFGITNWSDGLVFEQVQADLEAEGYEVQPFVLPACAVNAPHRRDRVWFVAHSTEFRRRAWSGEYYDYGKRSVRKGQANNGDEIRCFVENGLQHGIATDTDRNGHELRRSGENRPAQGESTCEQEQRERVRTNDRGTGEQGITSDTNLNLGRKRRVYSSRSEKTKRHTRSRYAQRYRSNTWDNFPTQPPVCSRNDGLSSKLDGITFSKWRNESIKAYGNAIVPQVALQIFKAIKKFSDDSSKKY